MNTKNQLFEEIYQKLIMLREIVNNTIVDDLRITIESIEEEFDKYNNNNNTLETIKCNTE